MQLSCVLLVALNLSTSSIRADVPGTRPLYRSLTATKNAQPQDALTRGAAIALLTVTAIIVLAGAATQMRNMSSTKSKEEASDRKKPSPHDQANAQSIPSESASSLNGTALVQKNGGKLLGPDLNFPFHTGIFENSSVATKVIFLVCAVSVGPILAIIRLSLIWTLRFRKCTSVDYGLIF